MTLECLDKKEMLTGIKEVYSYCEHCGKPEQYLTEKGTLEMTDHRKCRRIAKFKRLSITSKYTDGNKFEKAEINNDKEKKYFEIYKKYVEHFELAKAEGVGFLLLGSSGTGKTFAADCIANELTKRGYAVLSFTISGYLNEVKNSFDKKNPVNDVERNLLKAVEEADLTIIDDVGSEKISEGWGAETMFNLFNTIYNNKKAVIVTSNLSASELARHLTVNGSNKIADRITELCKPLVYDWESRRAGIGKDKFKKIFG